MIKNEATRKTYSYYLARFLSFYKIRDSAVNDFFIAAIESIFTGHSEFDFGDEENEGQNSMISLG